VVMNIDELIHYMMKREQQLFSPVTRGFSLLILSIFSCW
jgi:hypothetical protein